jgi:enoyl-CoA hydratase/carnithine racemase
VSEAIVNEPANPLAVTPAGIATLVICGEKKLNIIGSPAIAAACAELAALRPAAERGELRALVVRGLGDDTFVGGADIREMVALDAASAATFIEGLRSLCEAVRLFPCPVIARLAGWCLGAGLEVAAACDLRITAASAKFGMPETKVGIPSVIHAALLPRLIGSSRAGWLLLTGESIDAATARQWGLVHECVADAALDATVAERAAALAAMGPATLRQQKRMLREWETMSVDAAIAASVGEFAAAFGTGEPQRFMGAFLSRRA